jgi:tetratricopeptide (TPR) repeat protein
VRHALLFAAFVLVASPALAADSPPPSPHIPVMAKLRELETAALKGGGPALRDQLQAQIDRAPKDWMLRVYAAWCTMPSDKAWNELKDVSLHAQDLPWPNLGMARVYVTWKMRDLADQELKIALKKSPGFYPAFIVQGDLARLAGHPDAAIALYQQALQAADDPAAHAGLGLALLAQGKTADARAELSRGVDAWPSQPDALVALADLATTEKDSAEALKRYRQILDLSPKDKRARRALADLAFDGGDQASAAGEYLRLVDEGETDAEVFRRLGTMMEQVKAAPSAERVFLKLADLDPKSPDPYYRLADLAEAQGDLARAEKRLVSASARVPEDPAPRVRLARLRAKREQFALAVEAYRSAQALGALPQDVAAELTDLSARLKLPAAPARGSLDKIYAQVSTSLNALYAERVKETPDLSGTLKIRVTVGDDGRASAVDMVEDSVKDPLVAGHAYLALKDAQYPKQRREPVFELELKPPRKGTK